MLRRRRVDLFKRNNNDVGGWDGRMGRMGEDGEDGEMGRMGRITSLVLHEESGGEEEGRKRCRFLYVASMGSVKGVG